MPSSGPKDGETLARDWIEFRKYVAQWEPLCMVMPESEYNRMRRGAPWRLADVLRWVWEEGWVAWTASDRKAFERRRALLGLRKDLTLLAVRNAWAVRKLATGGSLENVAKNLGLSVLQAKRLCLA